MCLSSNDKECYVDILTVISFTKPKTETKCAFRTTQETPQNTEAKTILDANLGLKYTGHRQDLYNTQVHNIISNYGN